MGRLQELLHDDEKPIQNSTGLPRDHNRSKEIDENGSSLYKRPSKTADMPHRLLSTSRTLDPIQHLPPELAALFIQNALPSHTHLHRGSGRSSRSSRLIELTAVSEKWQSFLCSTPVLWSELVLDSTQEDLLAILSVFVALSGKAALKLTFLKPGKFPDWTGLTGLLLPVIQRIADLDFIGAGSDVNWIFSVISTVFGRLGDLPHLNTVNFGNVSGPGDLPRAASLLLPSTIKIEGCFRIKVPESCWNSGTPGKFFDIIKYNAFTNLDPTRLASNSFSLRYNVFDGTISIRSNDDALSHLQSLARRLAEHNCFEELVCRTSPNLQYLGISIRLSQVQDVIDCLRLLMRLQELQLDIQIEDSAKSLNWAPKNTACRDLRAFWVSFRDGDVAEIMLSAERTLRDLFSAFETLYPSVEIFSFYGHTWPSFASSYLQSLRALKSLSLYLKDSKYNPPEGYITLHSLQKLKIDGPAYFDSLHAPNLLKLSVYPPNSEAWRAHLSHPHIRSLVIGSHESTHDLKVVSLDCTDLRCLRLYDIPFGVTQGLLSLSNVVSITLTYALAGVVNPSTNQLCLAMLCHPKQLPALQQLHFHNIVDWDVLFLMLQRRNISQNGVKRIDTVTLSFIPFPLQQSLACLLAGEIVELPSLASLSLEATREVMFDSTVGGCLACLHCMRPGCTAVVSRLDDFSICMRSADAIYPAESIALETVPAEIRDWLRLRGDLIEIWRACYEKFAEEFRRDEECKEFGALLDGVI